MDEFTPTSASPQRVAFVSGAASPIGIGAATVRHLARDGWSVFAFDIDGRVEATCAELRSELDLPAEQLRSSVGDVSREADVEQALGAALSHFGQLDLMVANAGIAGIEEDVVDQTADAFDRIVDVNLRGVYLCVRAAGRAMRHARSGSIVTVSSIFGLEPFAKAAAYSATKAGVIALTQALALELAPFGIRVNSIAPGYIETQMQAGGRRARAERAGRTYEEEGERVDAMVPLHRHGTGDDIAASVAFLASEGASYITGHTLVVSGGVVMR